MPKTPDLTFFTELDAQTLKHLFDDRFVMDDLKTLNAAVSLGILDLSPERAEVVKKLNKLKIPVIAWLLLPKEEGYWFNLENYAFAIRRYEHFKRWSEENDLKWAGIGLDIEPDFGQAGAYQARDPRIVSGAIKRLFNPEGYQNAMLAYAGLVEQIHKDGWKVEVYHIPLIIEERKANATVLQRVMGLVDVPADREVLMLYSSFIRPYGHKVLRSYAEDTDSIGLGVTGGGVELEGVSTIPFMTWDEFSHDLRLAWQSGKPVHIFSLEGCVEQGFLSRLITFDWYAPSIKEDTCLVDTGRRALTGLLWLLQRPTIILAGLVGGILSGILSKKNRKKRQKTV